MKKNHLSALIATLLLASCAVGPDYQRPHIQLPQHYPAVSSAAADTAELPPDWWTLYGDALLNQLIADAFTHYPDVRLALATIEEAQGFLKQVNGALFPEIAANAGASRSRMSALVNQNNSAPLISSNRLLNLSTNFELDFWGKLRRTSESARAQLLASNYAYEVTTLSLASTVAQTYFNLRALDAQIAIVQNTLAAFSEAATIARNRAASGLNSAIDVQRADNARAASAIELYELQRQRVVAEHQLGALTGKLDLQIAANPKLALPIPPLPPAGLPSALLERRPDVRQAEQNLIASNARIGVVKAELFPTISLTASVGRESNALSSLFSQGSQTWLGGLNLFWPVFASGKYSAQVEQAQAREKQLLASYQKTVETAFREVADALTNLQEISQSDADAQIRFKTASEVLRLTGIRYDAGYAPYVDVLDAQRDANESQLAYVRNRQAYLVYSVDFMKALGGGWKAQ